MQRYGSFEGFPLNGAWLDWEYYDHCFFGQELTHVGLFCSWIFLKFASKRPYDECSFSWQSLACSLVQFVLFSTRHRFKQKSSVQTPFNVFPSLSPRLVGFFLESEVFWWHRLDSNWWTLAFGRTSLTGKPSSHPRATTRKSSDGEAKHLILQFEVVSWANLITFRFF